MRAVTLTGWAQPHDGLEAIAPGARHLDYSDAKTPEAVFEQLKTHATETDRLVGWSLGGWLLMRALQEKHISTRQLVLIAPPLQFVADPEFPHGMDAETFRLFYGNYREHPERTASRFTGLIAKGDRDHKRIVAALGHWDGSADAARWHPWLDTLQTHRAAHFDFAGFPPTLIFHGRQDAIVPFDQGRELGRRIPGAALHIFPEAGHAPHLHDAEAVRAAIETHAKKHGIDGP